MKLLMALLCLVLVSCQSTKQFKIDNTVKRDDIVGRMHMLLKGVDDRNWNQIEEVFAEKVEVDLGQGVSTLSRAEFVKSFQEKTAGLDGIQHVVSNYGIVVKDDRAYLSFNGIETHYKKSKTKKPTRSFYGSYEVEMFLPKGTPDNWGWEITKYKYINKFNE